jgi:hypothetical protein
MVSSGLENVKCGCSCSGMSKLYTVNMLVRRRNQVEVGWTEPETGWFGSKLVKKASHAVGSVAKVVSHAPGISNVLAAPRLAADIARGKNVGASLKRTAKTAIGGVKTGLSNAATVSAFIPGVGTAAGAGLSAASAASEGKSFREIGEEAALGAVPGGRLARSALRAGVGIARGQNVVSTVGKEGIAYARQYVPGGQLGQRALNVGLSVAQGGNVASAVKREGVAYARQNLPALPANIQSVVSSVTSTKVPMALRTNLTRPSFGLPRSASPENIASARRLSVGLRRPDFRPQIQSKNARASFRPLSMSARQMLVNALPHMRGEVSGLTETGAQWIVESGDTGSKIALKLTGNANRWTELRAINKTGYRLNPDMVKKYGFPVRLGEKLNLPASWIKVTAQTASQSAPATPSQSAPPPVAMPAGDIAAQGQARTILTAWGKSDGRGEAGVPDYGSASELQSTTWSARDVLEASSFAGWWRRNGGVPAVDGGDWSDALSQALNRWMENKAKQVLNTAVGAGGAVVPPVTTPTTPAAAPSPGPMATVPQVVLPQGTIPISGTPVTYPTSPIPTVVTTPSAPAPAEQPNVGAQAGFTSGQKWGFGSLIAGTVIGGFVRAMM